MGKILAVKKKAADLVFVDNYHFITGRHAVQTYHDLLSRAEWFDRDTIEKDENYWQLIPYVIITHHNPGHLRRNSRDILTMTRQPKQSEERLHGLHYIGVGGHVEEDDDVGYNSVVAFNQGMVRELEEELTPDYSFISHFSGIIIDNRNPVGRCHVGFLHHAHVNIDFDFAEFPEYEHHKHRWEEIDRLKQLGADKVDPWTDIVLRHYLTP